MPAKKKDFKKTKLKVGKTKKKADNHTVIDFKTMKLQVKTQKFNNLLDLEEVYFINISY
jgi:hypothetical protein